MTLIEDRTRLALYGGAPTITEKFAEKWPPMTSADAQDVADMVLRGELSYYGREGYAKDLEDQFRDYLPCRYALATSSGTAALHSAFFALNLSPGDEVLAPTYTFLATVMPLFALNLVPVLVDSDPVTGNMDPDDIERHIGPRTRAIVLTHMWGIPCDMRRIMQIARKHGIAVVEDCSHAHGAEVDGQRVGTIGDIGAFSLQGKKLVAAGQGGMLTCNDRNLFERAVLFGHFKVRSFQDVTSSELKDFGGTGLGLNYRMHPLAARLAHNQFVRLEEYIDGRRSNFELLSSLLAGIPGVIAPQVPDYADRCVWYSYKPLFDQASLPTVDIDTYVAALRAEGVEIERSETRPLHCEPIFQGKAHDHVATFGHFDSSKFGGGLRRYKDSDFRGSMVYSSKTLVIEPYTRKNPKLMHDIAAAFRKVSELAYTLPA
ncbi:MAG: DegT/DnrJ/EryC1/StrS family aminotransferase [Sphingorhabdus sp.]|uniref:DegT/DnrJ/EryC1/StrS family aminotransferase n=1 Tax=Sphingorhabdus sp. TaxID=1902408 RepID=UPI0025EC19CB|nr:DegT/DnrJ/EryC1/StrS family aminotransferase [Sphingorhabdus sp.]MCO4091542.1 DegT/DnrJ/EryC1/StrS family aminotransferase [Sphingorhabdus sp.]